MKITVFGTGYVGLVTGACFAQRAHEVACMDVDRDKVARLRAGMVPIYEPGLDLIVKKGAAAGRLRFTTDPAAAVAAAPILFVAVGTPSAPDGAVDTGQVLAVADAIGDFMDGYRLVVLKSTVPVGTAAMVEARIAARLRARRVDHPFDVASNPEFLREGSAVADCLTPARVVVGCRGPRAAGLLGELYAPFVAAERPLILMDVASAELTKYAANAMLAARLALMGEMSRVCEQVGADIEQVRRGIGSDGRIGPHYLHAGVGYGGSCFPKDVRALIRTGATCGEDLAVLRAVEAANRRQGERFFERIAGHFGGDLRGRRIALWGLAFKPGTDDVREAPAVDLARRLLAAGARVHAHDPAALSNARRALAGLSGLTLHGVAYDALRRAEALCVMTEWDDYKAPDFARVAALMATFVLFDGRNLYRGAGLEALPHCRYHAVGCAPPMAPVAVPRAS